MVRPGGSLPGLPAHRDDPRRHPRRLLCTTAPANEGTSTPGSPSAAGTSSLTSAPSASSVAAIRSGRAIYKALTRQITGYRTLTGRGSAPSQQVRVPQHDRPRAGREETRSPRTAPCRHHPRQQAHPDSRNSATTRETTQEHPEPHGRPADDTPAAAPSRKLAPSPANGDQATTSKRKSPSKACKMVDWGITSAPHHIQRKRGIFGREDVLVCCGCCHMPSPPLVGTQRVRCGLAWEPAIANRRSAYPGSYGGVPRSL